jgi:hypothetical protein
MIRIRIQIGIKTGRRILLGIKRLPLPIHNTDKSINSLQQEKLRKKDKKDGGGLNNLPVRHCSAVSLSDTLVDKVALLLSTF